MPEHSIALSPQQTQDNTIYAVTVMGCSLSAFNSSIYVDGYSGEKADYNVDNDLPVQAASKWSTWSPELASSPQTLPTVEDPLLDAVRLQRYKDPKSVKY